MNIAFYVSGPGTRLKNIIKEENIEVNHAIKLIVNDEENVSLENMAEERGISYRCFLKKIESMGKRGFSDKLLREMSLHNIDYLFVFGKQLLRGEILSKYKNKMINFHPSILPMFSGFHAIDRAIEARMTILGNTAHFIDESIDGGPIILQSVISADVFYQKGYEGVLKYQEKMFFLLFKLFKNNSISVNEKNQVKIRDENYEGELLIPCVK